MNEFDKTVIRMYNEDCSTYEIAKKLDTYPNKIRRTNARQAMFSPDMKRIAVATFQSGSKFGPIIYQTPYEKQSRKKKSKKRPNKK